MEILLEVGDCISYCYEVTNLTPSSPIMNTEWLILKNLLDVHAFFHSLNIPLHIKFINKENIFKKLSMDGIQPLKVSSLYAWIFSALRFRMDLCYIPGPWALLIINRFPPLSFRFTDWCHHASLEVEKGKNNLSLYFHDSECILRHRLKCKHSSAERREALILF